VDLSYARSGGGLELEHVLVWWSHRSPSQESPMTDVLAPSPSATSAAVEALGYRPFDADNHYYEALDAFTRHLDPAPRHPGVRVGGDRRRSYPVSAARCSAASRTPPSTRWRSRACWPTTSAATPTATTPSSCCSRHEPIRPEYRDRDARLATMDAHGPGQGLALPHPRDDLRGRRSSTTPGGDAPVHRLQPVARGGLGLRLPGPHLRGAVPHAGRRRLGLRRARVGPRPRGAHHRHPPGRGHHRRRPPRPGVRPSSTRSGPA
jgi:hypothetical protein